MFNQSNRGVVLSVVTAGLLTSWAFFAYDADTNVVLNDYSSPAMSGSQPSFSAVENALVGDSVEAKQLRKAELAKLRATAIIDEGYWKRRAALQRAEMSSSSHEESEDSSLYYYGVQASHTTISNEEDASQHNVEQNISASGVGATSVTRESGENAAASKDQVVGNDEPIQQSDTETDEVENTNSNTAQIGQYQLVSNHSSNAQLQTSKSGIVSSGTTNADAKPQTVSSPGKPAQGVHIADERSSVRVLAEPTTTIAAPDSKIAFTAPVATPFVNTANMAVSGSVELTRNLDGVTVNGQSVVWSSGTFTANVPLQEGFNTVTALADYGRRTHRAEMGVTLDTVKPSVVSAVSFGPKAIVLQFSEPMRADSLGNPLNFNIVDSVTNTNLPVMAVSFADASQTAIELVTGAQSDLAYTLTVGNIKDRAGNSIEERGPLGRFTPAEAFFTGTAPTGSEIEDQDGDGLSDHVELRGWPVVVQRADGSTENFNVNSDPLLPDTDGDGVTDNEERHGGIDPRNGDTDGDTLTDNEEWNQIYSDPTNQDTDGDGTQDGFEFYSYRTSPVLADTDGDQISDTDEVLGRNRDPRIADIPRAGIVVGEVLLQIDERFTFEDSQGATQTVESSSTSSLVQSENSSYASSNTDVNQHVASARVEAGFEGPGGRGTAFLGGAFINVEGSYQYTNSNSFTTSSESARESQQTHEQSLNKTKEFSSTSTVTREVHGARIDVELTLLNAGDLAFTIKNLEITVLKQDRRSTGKFIPVATLIPNTTLLTGEEAEYNLGPFTPERGPILFSSQDVFPNLVEELMQAPSGLIFKVANFDMTDEDGRIYTFANQIARDRTAGVIIDFGDIETQQHLVATALQPDPDGYGGEAGEFVGGFNADGSPVGIPLDFALQDTLGMRKNVTDTIVAGDDEVLQSIAQGDDELDSDNGVINSGPNRVLDTTPAGDDSIMYAVDGILAGFNRTADSVAAGDDVQLIPPGTTGLSAGSVVISAGLNNILETIPQADEPTAITTGYETMQTCALPTATLPALNPRDACVVDSDCDSVVVSDGLGSCSGPEVLQRVGSLRNGDFNRTWAVLTNRSLPVGAGFGSVVLQPGADLFLAFVQDLDEDGLFAREEYLLGSTDSRLDNYVNSTFGVSTPVIDNTNPLNPVTVSYALVPPTQMPDAAGIADSKDTDKDGIGDFAEARIGWLVANEAGGLQRVFTSPRLSDSDGDGLLDLQEQDLRSFCDTPTDGRVDALCSFQARADVVQSDAIGIIAGRNGVVDTVAAAGDLQLFDLNEPGQSLTYGTVVIGVGKQAGIQTALMGDDLYISEESLNQIPPTTDPTLADSDFDGISDFVELHGFDVGLSVRDGGNGIANTQAVGDDFQRAFINNPVEAPQGGATLGGIVVLPGANGQIDSVIGGDDRLQASINVVTDPLRIDTDGDSVSDGREGEQGGNPRNPLDGASFVDSDRDGLTDAEETVLGWIVQGTSRRVLSNPNLADTDRDGLPDLVERDIRTDPNNRDTDGDLITDYQEFDNFEDYFGLEQQFPGFSVTRGSTHYGTNPTRTDTDFDGLSDYAELIQGYRMLLPTTLELKVILTNPLISDTDFDGVNDGAEAAGFVYHPDAVTDATNSDTDGDGRTDNQERISGSNPLRPDISVRVSFARLKLEGGPTPYDAQWRFSVGKNADFPGQTLSTQADFNETACGSTTKLDTFNLTAFNLNNAYRDITLEPGEGFSITASVVEVESCNTYVPQTCESFLGGGLMLCSLNPNQTCSVDSDCPPLTSPQYNACDMQQSEFTSYETIVESGFTGKEINLTDNTCNAIVTYFISVN